MKKGSAVKLSEEDKKKAMDNAMPDAKVNSRNYDDLKTDKAEMSASKKRLAEAKQRASIGGDPEKKAYAKTMRREEKIQSQLNVSPLKKTKSDRIRGRKGGSVKNVTERLNEGDYKSARLERRGNVAAGKGKKAKAKRLRRKADESNQKFFKDQVQRRGEK